MSQGNHAGYAPMRRNTRRLTTQLSTVLVVLALLNGWSSRHPFGAALAAAQCAGDCNGDGEVTVDELIIGVNIALDTASLSRCSALDTNHDGIITIDEIIAAVNTALNGCTGGAPTPTATATSIPTATVTATPTTATGNESVCGGPVTSVPKLCNLTIMPNPVRPGGDATITLSGSDLEGDDNSLCNSIVPKGAPPNLQCSGISPPNMRFNQSFSIGPVQIVPPGTPAGEYTLTIQVRDAAGHQSNSVSTDFSVVESPG